MVGYIRNKAINAMMNRFEPARKSAAARWLGTSVLALAGAAWAHNAAAHPHVFAEANLEIVRDADGAVLSLRHVWRFDPLFSSTVMLDFDTDANGTLEPSELDEVSSVVTRSIGEQGWFTEVRLGLRQLEFEAPDKIMVDYVEGQVLMFFETEFEKPVETGTASFRVSVADPTYYVAMDIVGEAAVQVTGKGSECQIAISRPDYDQLYAQNQSTLTEQFFEDPETVSFGDEWFTWVDMTCDT